MHLIDTNIFLEILLGRRRKEECKRFLKRIQMGKETGVVTDFSIHSMIVIMDSFKKFGSLKRS